MESQRALCSPLAKRMIYGVSRPSPEFFQGVYQNLFGPTQFEKAKAAYDSKDYATAAQLWLPLADHGDAMAQFYLGWLYEEGMGVPRNYAEAAKWYRLSAELQWVTRRSGHGPGRREPIWAACR
jgi:TPR repeat protein